MQQTPSLFTRGKRVFARFKGLATVLVVAAISILFMGFAFTLRGGFLVYIPRSCFDSQYVHSSISSLVIKRFFTVLTGQADIPMILYDNIAESTTSYKLNLQPLIYPSFCVPLKIPRSHIDTLAARIPSRLQLQPLIDARTANGSVSVCGWFREERGLFIYLPQYQSASPWLATKDPTKIGRRLSTDVAVQ